MASHEYIVQAIRNYLESDQPNTALMLSGDWGAGKTHFWKHSVVPYLDETGRQHIYVSLYGVSSLAEIEQQVSYGIFPFLDSKAARAVRFVAEIRGIRVPPISFVPKLHRAVFCFDDFERSDMPVMNVLGYINRFIEQYGSHVLILANELQIEDQSYKARKEKVVGKTLSLKPNVRDAIDNIWSSLSKKKHNLLDVHRQTIESVISNCEPINLRSVIQAIENCNVVLHHLEKLPPLARDAAKEIMSMTCALTMEDRANRELLTNLKGLFADPTTFMFAGYVANREEDGNDMLKAVQCFATRYFNGSVDNIPSLSSIVWFIETGWIEIEMLLAEALAISRSKLTKEEDRDPKDLFLKDIWALSDEQIEEISNFYVGEVKATSITGAARLARVFATLTFLAKHQVISQNPAELLTIFLRSIDRLNSERRFTEQDFQGWDGQRIFYGPVEKEVDELIVCLSASNKQLQEQLHQKRLSALFVELDTDYDSFLQRMVGNLDDDYFDYQHRPVLASFDPKAVAEILARKSANDIQHFGQLLSRRYFRVANIADYLSEEHAVLVGISDHLEHLLKDIGGGLKRVAIAGVIDQLRKASAKLQPPEHKPA